MTNEELADQIMSSISSDKFSREDLLALLQKVNEEREEVQWQEITLEEYRRCKDSACRTMRLQDFGPQRWRYFIAVQTIDQALAAQQERFDKVLDESENWQRKFENAQDRIAELEQEITEGWMESTHAGGKIIQDLEKQVAKLEQELAHEKALNQDALECTTIAANVVRLGKRVEELEQDKARAAIDAAISKTQ